METVATRTEGADRPAGRHRRRRPWPSAVASLVGVELGLDRASTWTSRSSGRPPALVVGWSSATVGGSLRHDARAAAPAAARFQTVAAELWPPGPQAIGAATAPIVEALAFGSRRLHQAMTMLDGELGRARHRRPAAARARPRPRAATDHAVAEPAGTDGVRAVFHRLGTGARSRATSAMRPGTIDADLSKTDLTPSTTASSTSAIGTGRPSRRSSDVTPRSAMPHGTISSK